MTDNREFLYAHCEGSTLKTGNHCKDMGFKGVVFDFNGTLLWDTGLHNQAWDVFLSRQGISLTDQEKNDKIHGKNNERIIAELFQRELPPDIVQDYILEKESVYQQLCLQSGIEYAPGAVDFIEFLKNRQIPYAIATASGKENIMFYLERMELGKLIDPEFILYNNGHIKSKPDPEIFNRAIRALQLKNHEVVVFEDSATGIQAAQNARPGKIVVVNSGTLSHIETTNLEVITDFNQVDRSIFY
jgi:beta-phosphoglucomutase